jgi:DNA primase
MVDFDVLSEISHSTSMLEVLDHYGINYHPAGPSRYKAICPFHNDHDPSLVIYTHEDNRNESFNCFVDNIGGDVFRFIQLMEQDFKKAWSTLCHIRGIKDSDALELDELEIASRALQKDSRKEEISIDTYNYQISCMYRNFLKQHDNDPTLCRLVDARFRVLDSKLDNGISLAEMRQFLLHEIQYIEHLRTNT